MTSSLVWDDVKFKMDGITTSAEKSTQHWTKSRLRGGKTVFTTGRVSVASLTKLPFSNTSREAQTQLVRAVKEKLFPPWRNSEGGLCRCKNLTSYNLFCSQQQLQCQAGVEPFLLFWWEKKNKRTKHNKTKSPWLPPGIAFTTDSLHAKTASLPAQTFISGLARCSPLKRAQLSPSLFGVSCSRPGVAPSGLSEAKQKRNVRMRCEVKAAYQSEKFF